jgi:hypothetical protein
LDADPPAQGVKIARRITLQLVIKNTKISFNAPKRILVDKPTLSSFAYIRLVTK